MSCELKAHCVFAAEAGVKTTKISHQEKDGYSCRQRRARCAVEAQWKRSVCAADAGVKTTLIPPTQSI